MKGTKYDQKVWEGGRKKKEIYYLSLMILQTIQKWLILLMIVVMKILVSYT